MNDERRPEEKVEQLGTEIDSKGDVWAVLSITDENGEERLETRLIRRAASVA